MNHHYLRTPRVTAQLALVAALLLAGCGSSSSHPSSRGAATPSARTTGATRSTTSPSGRSVTSRGHSHTTKPTGPAKHRSGAHSTGSTSTKTSAAKAPVPVLNPNPAPEPGCPKGVVPCVTKSPTLKPIGSPMIDVNLQQAIVADHPAVKQANVTCPSSTAYPIKCTFSGSAKAADALTPIKGTVVVLGVETSTRTYAYSLEYAPVTKK
jgi:hypothetical protein